METLPVMKGVGEAFMQINRVPGKPDKWRLTTNLLAWDRLEKLTGKNAGAYVEDQWDFRMSRYAELAWAFSASHRLNAGIDCTYDQFLEWIPADEEGLAKFRETIAGLLRHSPFGRMLGSLTETLILYLAKTRTDWMREILDQAETEKAAEEARKLSTGTTSPTSDSTSLSSESDSSGTPAT